MKIGFIGQGWIGKHYADDFENRGYEVVRYAREEKYAANKEKLAECEIVFIAVPTPTTPEGFDDSIVRNVLKLVGKGKIAVIKSTLLPGHTESIQKENSDIFVMHSPEFLREAHAAFDASHPNRNIIGITIDNAEHKQKAEEVLKVLPKAPYEKIMSVRDAELIKYAGNCFLVTKVIYSNIIYDFVKSVGGDWDVVREAFAADPRIGDSHTYPVDKSGRGAGGHCFIKDFEAFIEMYEEAIDDEMGKKILEAIRDKNVKLLKDSGKDLDLLEGVYGK